MANRPEAADLVMSDAEVEALTRYKRQAEQLAELQRRGFHRARIARDGTLILERAHYEAVCTAGTSAAREPRVRP